MRQKPLSRAERDYLATLDGAPIRFKRIGPFGGVNYIRVERRVAMDEGVGTGCGASVSPLTCDPQPADNYPHPHAKKTSV